MDHITAISPSSEQHSGIPIHQQPQLLLLRGRSLQEQNGGDSDASRFPKTTSGGGTTAGMNISSVIFYSALALFLLTQLCIKLYSCFVGRSRTGAVENGQGETNSQGEHQQQQPRLTKAEKRRNLSDTFEEQKIVKVRSQVISCLIRKLCSFGLTNLTDSHNFVVAFVVDTQAISMNDFIPATHMAYGYEIDDIETKHNASQDPPMVDAVTQTSEEPAIVDLENGMGPDAIIKLPDWKTGAPNCCAICLSEYEPGEVLVWSSNRSCMHVYHQECLLEYLVKVKDGSTPCPMCRQQFLIQEKNEEETSTAEPNPQTEVAENEEGPQPAEENQTR